MLGAAIDVAPPFIGGDVEAGRTDCGNRCSYDETSMNVETRHDVCCRRKTWESQNRNKQSVGFPLRRREHLRTPWQFSISIMAS